VSSHCHDFTTLDHTQSDKLSAVGLSGSDLCGILRRWTRTACYGSCTVSAGGLATRGRYLDQIRPALAAYSDSRRIPVTHPKIRLWALLSLILVVMLLILCGCGAEEGRRARDLADEFIADSLDFAEGFCAASVLAPISLGVVAVALRRRHR
jgi:hypothetical protein